MSKPHEFRLPPKGVVKNTAFSDYSGDASPDALNVVPWDRQGRSRLAQRRGTTKVNQAAIGAPSSVVWVGQCTLSKAGTSQIVADTRIFDADFTAMSTGALETVDPGRWRSQRGSETFGYSTPSLGLSNTERFDQWRVVTTTRTFLQENVTPPGAGDYLPLTAAVTTNVGQGGTYIVRATVYNMRLDGTVQPYRIRLITRIDTNTWNNNSTAVWAEFTLNSAAIYAGSTLLASGTFSTFKLGEEHVLDLRVAGNTFQVYVDGVFICQTTSTSGNGFTGLGLGLLTFGTWNNQGELKRFEVYSGQTTTTPNPRDTQLVAVSNGYVYQGTLATGLTQATGSQPALSVTTQVGAAFSQRKMYFVDGSNNITKLDLDTAALEAYTATAGTAPQKCTLAAMYRDRLVLAAPTDNPQNFFFSRVGVHTDWDYAQTDNARAFAGNASVAGRIGEPIISLMPASDDTMFIGGDHNMWVIRGDPADGGSIDLVSDSIGVLGSNAWTKAPDGTIYFVGTGGVYRMAPGGSTPELLTGGMWNSYFANINRVTNHVVMAWDRDNHGAYIFVTPSATASATHLWYDARTNGLYPIQFPDSHGPIHAVVIDGDGPSDRMLLLGGRDGFVRKLDPAALNDDGTAISSYVYLGPYRSSDVTESTLEWMDVILGDPSSGIADDNYNVTVSVQAGQTVEQALTNPKLVRSRTFTSSRRQTRWIQRTRGNAFVLKLSNTVADKVWNFDKAIAMFMDGGLVRRR